MFDIHSITFFNNSITLGCAIIVMNRNFHVSKFKIIFKIDENNGWSFYYENNICLDYDERADFENWFICEAWEKLKLKQELQFNDEENNEYYIN